jgi:hypothetical protein
MLPFTKSPPTVTRTLKDVLLETNRLVVASEESDWSGFSPKEISLELLTAVAAIDEKKKLDVATLQMHFAPTGPIQETAMSNEWTNDYMRLSSEFDDLIKTA